MLAVNRDPTLQEYSTGKPSKDTGCYAFIHSGGQLVRTASPPAGRRARLPQTRLLSLHAAQPTVYHVEAPTPPTVYTRAAATPRRR